jgi:hypothetical protein
MSYSSARSCNNNIFHKAKINKNNKKVMLYDKIVKAIKLKNFYKIPYF